MRGEEGAEEDVLRRIWYYEILPLLNEYFYNEWEKLKFVLGGSFVEEKRLTKLADGEVVDEDEAVVFEFKGLEGDDFKEALIKLVKAAGQQ